MAEHPDPQTVPRGRHAPPLEVRLSVQRRRLFEAAADVFARVGYADASAEAISREAGMSKATFYEQRVEAGVHALLETLATYRTSAQTLLVQIIGAGPRAAARRDAILDAFADSLYRDNQRAAPQYGAPTFASPDD